MGKPRKNSVKPRRKFDALKKRTKNSKPLRGKNCKHFLMDVDIETLTVAGFGVAAIDGNIVGIRTTAGWFLGPVEKPNFP